jgi:flagellar protein FlaG
MGVYVEPQAEVQAEIRQERPQEKRPPLPIERGEAVGNAGATHSSAHEKPELKQVTAELEQISLAFDRRLKFVIDSDTRDIIIKVIDNETDKVIKELPPEELRRLHDRISETIGFLFDTMV